MAENKTYDSVVDLLRDSEETRNLADQLSKRLADRFIIKQLMALRACKRLSQSDIAARLDCTQSRVSKLESGSDDELKLGDLERYLDALGLQLKLVVTPKGLGIAAEIKHVWHCLCRLLNRLLDMAQKNNDATIAAGIGKLSNEIAFNYTDRILDFVNQLPAEAKNEVPWLSLEVQDEELNSHPRLQESCAATP